MKRFAILFAALCMVAFVADNSHAQCRGGGGFYGGGYYGGGYRPVVYGNQFGGGYGNFYRPNVGVYRGYGYGVARPIYHHGYGNSLYRPGFGYGNFYGGRGISIRF